MCLPFAECCAPIRVLIMLAQKSRARMLMKSKLDDGGERTFKSTLTPTTRTAAQLFTKARKREREKGMKCVRVSASSVRISEREFT